MHDPEGAQRLRESVDISVKPQARPCYNIYVTLSVVVYSFAHIYGGIIALQVMYYTVRRYHISLTFQKVKKRRDGGKCKR